MNNFLKLIIFFICITSAAEAKLFNAQNFFLPNGMQCVVIENHKAPLIKHMVWYKIGAAFEDYGKGGSAHLLEHLMFRGTKRVQDKEFNRMMEKNGAESNAFTGHDMTVYHQFADISKLEVLMALEADRMRNLSFDKNAFLTEQKIVFQERKQVVENNPASPFNERLEKILWGNLPYGHPVTGLSDEIMALKYKDTTKFYQNYYTPNNAILILSGDIDIKTAKDLAFKYYGSIPSHEIIKKQIPENTEYFSETLEMSLPNVGAAKMVQKSLLPSHKKLNDGIYDYMLLSEYLGGSETSALYKSLVIDKKIAVSVSSHYHFLTDGNTVFSVNMVPVSSDKEEVKQAWQTLIEAQDIAVDKLTNEKLEQIKRKIFSDLVYVNDNPQDAAYWVGYMLVSGFDLDDVENYEDNIKKVTVKSIKTAYEELKKSSVVRATLFPQTTNPNSGGD